MKQYMFPPGPLNAAAGAIRELLVSVRDQHGEPPLRDGWVSDAHLKRCIVEMAFPFIGLSTGEYRPDMIASSQADSAHA